MNELKAGYCPLCDEEFEFNTESFIAHCPICGHHLSLHQMCGKGCIPQKLEVLNDSNNL